MLVSSQDGQSFYKRLTETRTTFAELFTVTIQQSKSPEYFCTGF